MNLTIAKIIAEGRDLPNVYANANKISKDRTPLFEHIPENFEEDTIIL